MAFTDYWSELLGHIPEIDPLLAQKLVNRAWNDIRDARLWSWQRGVGVLIAPQLIFAGTVTVTQFSPTVTLDATATTALTGLTNPLVSLRQFRSSAGPMYNIASVLGSTLTLDRPYMENSGAGMPYQVYRCYYQPTDNSGNTVTDFVKWKAILNPISGYVIRGKRLNMTRAELDGMDPTRGSQDLAYYVAAYNVGSNGVPIYELWPHPTSLQGYVTFYQRRGVDLSNSQDVPITMGSRALIEHSLEYAYEWAIANATRFDKLKDVNWSLLKAETSRRYATELQKCKIQDDNIAIDSYLPGNDYRFGFPVDSNWMQSHDFQSFWND